MQVTRGLGVCLFGGALFGAGIPQAEAGGTWDLDPAYSDTVRVTAEAYDYEDYGTYVQDRFIGDTFATVSVDFPGRMLAEASATPSQISFVAEVVSLASPSSAILAAQANASVLVVPTVDQQIVADWFSDPGSLVGVSVIDITDLGNRIDLINVFGGDTSGSATVTLLAGRSYALSTRGFTLVPFRTVAVDSSVVPLGTVLYIPSARGTRLVLPTGEERIHDGYFFAADRGGAIKGRHIDVFIGPASESPFEFVRSHSAETFAAYPIRSQEITEILGRSHRLRPGKSAAPL